MTIGKRIRQARKTANLTQRELGERLGVSAAMIGQYENDLRKPKIETVHRIASALGVNADCFVEGNQNSPEDGIKQPNLIWVSKSYHENECHPEQMWSRRICNPTALQEYYDLAEDVVETYNKEARKAAWRMVMELEDYKKTLIGAVDVAIKAFEAFALEDTPPLEKTQGSLPTVTRVGQ